MEVAWRGVGGGGGEGGLRVWRGKMTSVVASCMGLVERGTLCYPVSVRFLLNLVISCDLKVKFGILSFDNS